MDGDVEQLAGQREFARLLRTPGLGATMDLHDLRIRSRGPKAVARRDDGLARDLRILSRKLRSGLNDPGEAKGAKNMAMLSPAFS